jgi:TorA maturation chaperone TorD
VSDDGMTELSPHALVFVAWSRVWSPLVDDALRREAWEQLQLPGDFDANASDFLRAFHVAMPQPPATLLLHAALNQDGGSVREDFVRIMDYLDVEYEDAGRLAPDHLACACEIFALAIHADEPVLVQGLRERYLGPWTAMARGALGEHPVLSGVVDQFGEDLAAI